MDEDLLDRAKILLKATKDLLEKQTDSYYVLNLLRETVFYDGAECDGSHPYVNWFDRHFCTPYKAESEGDE